MESTVRVRLLSFGPWRHLFPPEGAVVEIAAGESVTQLLERLEAGGNISSGDLRKAAIAINETFVPREHVLADGDVVAILPPVSGGTDGPVRLTFDPIQAEPVLAEIKAAEDGAVVTFDGTVRNRTRGRETLYLDYEAYEPMALKVLQQLRAEALAQFSVREIVIVHRLGRVTVGESSVLIAVASAHRAAAFEACRWVIDTLKKSVPIWKHEQFVDGALWVEGEPFPEHLTGIAESKP